MHGEKPAKELVCNRGLLVTGDGGGGVVGIMNGGRSQDKKEGLRCWLLFLLQCPPLSSQHTGKGCWIVNPPGFEVEDNCIYCFSFCSFP